MFKHLMLYTLGKENFPPLLRLEPALASARFTECLPTQERSGGWVPPRGEANGALVESVQNQWLMRYRTESRILPGSVVRRETEKRLAKLEELNGRKVGKKQAREIREDTFIQLLPQAFTRQDSCWVWIDPMAGTLAIEAGSQARADEVLTSLFKAVAGLTAAPLSTMQAPAGAMASWLAGRVDCGDFDIGRECELGSTDDQKSTVRYVRHHLDNAEIVKHVEGGKVPTRLAMGLYDRVSFVLTDRLQLKKIRFLEGVFEVEEEEQDRFDADATIATAEMAKVIGMLVEVLGGCQQMI